MAYDDSTLHCCTVTAILQGVYTSLGALDTGAELLRYEEMSRISSTHIN